MATHRTLVPKWLVLRCARLMGIATLLTFTSTGAARGADEPGSVVTLARAEDPTDIIEGRHRGLLAREVVRQAILMAAREGRGLTTRDGTLGEVVEGGTSGRPLRVGTFFMTGKTVKVTVRRPFGQERPPLWEREFPLPGGDRVDLEKLVEDFEVLSRGPFLEVIEKAGYGKKPGAGGRSESRVPANVAAMLDRMDLVAQFAAIRALHQALKTSRSPKLEGALVRGYANLGLLTEQNWDPSHKVFKARAMLYAQRMVGQAPSSWSLSHRAYARALSGMHQDALNDLKEAGKRPAGEKGEKPAWVGLIEASCRFDTAPLEAAGRDDHLGELALLLRFLALEDPATPLVAVNAGSDALETRPDLYRVIDGMCRIGGVANLHRSTEQGMRAIDGATLARLKDLPGLPGGARVAIPAGDVAVVEALLAAGESDKDTGEPSWAVLGNLIRQARFLVVWRRLQFMRDNLQVPVAEFLDESLPLVEGHPFLPFLEMYGRGGLSGRLAYNRLRTAFAESPGDVELTQRIEMMRAILQHDLEKGPTLMQNALETSLEGTYRDLNILTRSMALPQKRTMALQLLRVSPNAPLAAAILIENDWWEDVEPKAAGWEKAFARHPTVQLALGRRYAEMKKYDDSERCLRATIELSPEYWAYQALADVYAARGRLDRWQATLDEYLKQEDIGLDHARVRVEIANALMARGDYKAALPYAEDAGETWAQWAMRCAADCTEGLGDWDRSEMWIRRIAERYESPLEWYCWCHRTGRGDLASARRATLDSVHDDPNPLLVVGIMHYLDGEPREALEAFREAFKASNHPTDGLYLAIVAETLRDPGTRGTALRDVGSQGNRMGAVGAMLRDAAVAGGKGKLDLAALDRHLATVVGPARAELYFFVGRFLELWGQDADAATYLDRCVRDPEVGLLTRTVAMATLRRRSEQAKSRPAASPARKASAAPPPRGR